MDVLSPKTREKKRNEEAGFQLHCIHSFIYSGCEDLKPSLIRNIKRNLPEQNRPLAKNNVSGVRKS